MPYPAFLFTVMLLSHNRLRVWDRLYIEHFDESTNIQVVQSLTGNPDPGGMATIGDLGEIIVEWRSSNALVALIMAHEIGHAVGIGPHSSASYDIMQENAGVGDNRLNKSQASEYDD